MKGDDDIKIQWGMLFSGIVFGLVIMLAVDWVYDDFLVDDCKPNHVDIRQKENAMIRVNQLQIENDNLKQNKREEIDNILKETYKDEEEY
jgi:hypothetical protein|tara:strand:+ start:5764 stop:6033 length:270 start_codon:yes stop_codon:yes gene_type:complete